MAKTLRVSRKGISEKLRANLLLGDFDPYNSRGWDLIKYMTHHQVSRHALISLATILSGLIGIPFERDYSRRKDLVIKWFDTNYDEIIQFKDCFEIEYQLYGKTTTTKKDSFDLEENNILTK